MPSKDERIQAAKKLRKALQIALSNVQLDEDDVEEIGGVFDQFDPYAKYKKGEICTYGGKTYICLKTTKRGSTPDKDAQHWALFGGAATGPTDPEEPSADTYDPEKTYHKGDTCVYGGVTWTCNKNNVTGVEPGSDGKIWTAE